MVSDGTEFAVRDIERLFEEARRNTKAKHEKWDKYNRHRKCDETEIGTGSSDNGSLRDESSGFDRVQRRSNESQDGKKKGSEVKRELEGKGLSFKNDQSEKHTNKTNKRGPLIRSIPSSWSEKSRMIKRSKNQRFGYKRSHESCSGGPERKIQKGSEHRGPKRALSSNYRTNYNLPKFRKKSRKEETVTPTTSGYNLRPRSGKRVESRTTIERKTQQGGPVRSRKGRGRNDSPYIEERTRSSNKNARRGGDQQREANPQVYVETPLHPEKLTDALYGLVESFFKNDEGHNVTVNGDRYRAMITNFFIPELNNHDVQELLFQQDGATCHTARATIDLLKDTFGALLISRFGPVNWPPRSCDLTPLDYFLWGYVKSLVLCG
ncbi:uncharacterized protein TNCV_4492271 [Trichonephila clavipes]|nr:uncharacterized protein TNCV_4492271 [Trichonephila clavipes]